MSIDKRLDLLIRALEVLGNGFLSRGGSDVTSWDDCGECGRADWKGHKPECSIGRLIDDIRDEVGKSNNLAH